MKVYISKTKINKRIKEISSKLSREYKGKNPIFIGILNGAFVFLSDLIRAVDIDCEIDFMKLSSYGDSKITTGKVSVLKELNCQVEGRHIILVEDIIDSGISISYMKKLIESHNPASLKIVSLLFKKGVSNLDFKIDHIGFKIDNEFVVGYGLDYAQKYRNLNAIYVL